VKTDVETLLRGHMVAETQRIEPPAGLEQDVMAAIESAASGRPQPHGIVQQLAWSAAIVALVVGVAGSAAWLRFHKSTPPVGRPPVALTVTPSAFGAPSPEATVAASASPAPTSSPSATSRASATPSVEPSVSPTATPFNPGYTVPDAAAGSAIGYYAPGGYPILANQQVTGGQGFTTWTWNGSRWIEVLRGSGSPYVSGTMVYDPAIGMTVVIGGTSGSTGVSGWNGSAWVALAALPGGIQGQPYLAFDQGRNQLLLLDSSAAGATTWTFDGKAWKKINTAAAPQEDWGGGFAYDPRNGTTILFGGGYMGSPYGATWEWNGNTWTQLHPASSPPAGFAVMAFDAATQQMILLAENGTAWTWANRNWSRLASAVTPPFGAYAGLVYDASIQGLFLWEGGTGYEQGSQTWTYAGGVWVRRS